MHELYKLEEQEFNNLYIEGLCDSCASYNNSTRCIDECSACVLAEMYEVEAKEIPQITSEDVAMTEEKAVQAKELREKFVAPADEDIPF